MFVCCDCLLLSGRRLCDGPITRSKESHGIYIYVYIYVYIYLCVYLIECYPEPSKGTA